MKHTIFEGEDLDGYKIEIFTEELIEGQENQFGDSTFRVANELDFATGMKPKTYFCIAPGMEDGCGFYVYDNIDVLLENNLGIPNGIDDVINEAVEKYREERP